MLLSIIIVNYNTAKYLRECINSINLHLDSVEKEIIVSDNNSSDREIEDLAKENEDVKFIFRKSNDGFGAGCNDASEISTGKYLLFLNPDTKLMDDSISIIIESIESDALGGIYSGLLVDDHKVPQYCFNNFPDLLWEFYQCIGIGYDRKINSLLNRIEIKEEKQFNTDWFHGAFLLLRKDDFLSVNGFDEKYFMYYEDVELCYKIKTLLKKENMCIPQVRIYHHTQSSLENESTDDIIEFHMNRGKLLFIKNYSLAKKYSIHLIGLISVILRMITLPFRDKYNGNRKSKLNQLRKIMKLYLNKEYLNASKYEYIN